eukprot:8356452-Prorocentrum_lima.AAC.1
MTSSLVGSEMCIRDRQFGVGNSRTDERCLFQLGCSTRSVAQQHSLRPVSYTHLTLPTICSV